MVLRLEIKPNDKTLAGFVELIGERNITWIQNNPGELFGSVGREYQVHLNCKSVDDSIELLNKIKGAGYTIKKYNLDER
jgi:hypothetical protein